MKKHHKREIDNPWALAWSMHNKGAKSHYVNDPKGTKSKKEPKKKKEYKDEDKKDENFSFSKWLEINEIKGGQIPPKEPEFSSDPQFILRCYKLYQQTASLVDVPPEERQSRWAEQKAAVRKMRRCATRYLELTGRDIKEDIKTLDVQQESHKKHKKGKLKYILNIEGEPTEVAD
jgi:hypothetical protein